MRTKIGYIFLLALLTGACRRERPCMEEQPWGENEHWYVLHGSDSATPNFPDYYANYFVYNFDRSQIRDVGIHIEGFFGDARYLSYNVYDFGTGLGHSTRIDRNMEPNACSNNPFRTGGDASKDERRYTLFVAPQSMSLPAGTPNVLRFPDAVDTVSIFFRYYVPLGDAGGGQPLPYLSAFTEKQSLVSLPPQIARNFEDGIEELIAKVEDFLQVQIDSQLRFYNVNAEGMFTNLDAGYLATPITVQSDEVYLFKFRAPGYARNPADFASADLRYWSINIGDGRTHIRAALKDEDITINAQGWAEFVLAYDTPANRQRAAGRNFLPIRVEPGEPLGIIYRQLLPRSGFAGNVRQVPVLDGSEPVNVLLQDARYYIGDYAPRGVRISTQRYLQDFGGFFQ